MTKIELIAARWLARRIVRQGDHKRRITAMYALIADAAADEFAEDNRVTLHAFLRECFDSSNQPPNAP